MNFGGSHEKLRSDYLDVYEAVYAEVISTDRFDEDKDLSTTYLGPGKYVKGYRSKS